MRDSSFFEDKSSAEVKELLKLTNDTLLRWKIQSAAYQSLNPGYCVKEDKRVFKIMDGTLDMLVKNYCERILAEKRMKYLTSKFGDNMYRYKKEGYELF